MKNIKYILIFIIILISCINVCATDSYTIRYIIPYDHNQSVTNETLIRINQVRNLPEVLDYNMTSSKSYGMQIWNKSADVCYMLRVNEIGTLYTEAC